MRISNWWTKSMNHLKMHACQSRIDFEFGISVFVYYVFSFYCKLCYSIINLFLLLYYYCSYYYYYYYYTWLLVIDYYYYYILFLIIIINMLCYTIISPNFHYEQRMPFYDRFSNFLLWDKKKERKKEYVSRMVASVLVYKLWERL